MTDVENSLSSPSKRLEKKNNENGREGGGERRGTEGGDDGSAECDAHFEPIVSLPPLIEKKAIDEDEQVLHKTRAKLFVFGKDVEGEEQWKERGVGDMKILKNKETQRIRLLMRRDKTLKICCNHFLTDELELQPHISTDKAWVWSTSADFSDEESKHQMFCIRFKSPEIATEFKAAFSEAKSPKSDTTTTTPDSPSLAGDHIPTCNGDSDAHSEASKDSPIKSDCKEPTDIEAESKKDHESDSLANGMTQLSVKDTDHDHSPSKADGKE